MSFKAYIFLWYEKKSLRNIAGAHGEGIKMIKAHQR